MLKHPYVNLAVTISAVVALLIVIGVAASFIPDIIRHYRSQRILKEGISATAVVKEAKDTGTRYFGKPKVRLTLEVKPESGESYQAEIITIVSHNTLSKLQPGAVIHVKYDPKQPTYIALLNQ